MGYWNVPNIWGNSNVFIIGGGSSLIGEDLSPLKTQHVIGCNQAFKLEETDICYFGDLSWFDAHMNELSKWAGISVTCCDRLLNYQWLRVLRRGKKGLDTRPGHIAWNRCTGLSAINLALLLGAKNIILLGYDMTCNDSEGRFKPHWHNDYATKTIEHWNRVYTQFINASYWIERDLEGLNVKVWNANPNSAMTTFPFKDWRDFL